MRAAYFEAHGPTANIRVGERPTPVLGPNDALIRVRAASLNGFDPMILQGTTGLRTPLPMIPLGDCAGEIVELGPRVEGFSVGDRVCPFPFVLGEGMTGETRLGVACEYARFPDRNLLRIPEGVSFEHAACLPIAYGTAYRMLFARGAVKAGERVLILGATGGVGVSALELAKAAGCEVVACGSAEWKLTRLSELAADHVIDTSREDFAARIHELYGKPRMLGGGGVDVVINYIGGDTWVQSLKCLKRGGRMLTCGATAGHDPREDIRYIWTFELDIMGSNGWSPSDQGELLDMVAAGRLEPRIHDVRDLTGVAGAIQDLIDRKVFGKLVIRP